MLLKRGQARRCPAAGPQESTVESEGGSEFTSPGILLTERGLGAPSTDMEGPSPELQVVSTLHGVLLQLRARCKSAPSPPRLLALQGRLFQLCHGSERGIVLEMFVSRPSDNVKVFATCTNPSWPGIGPSCGTSHLSFPYLLQAASPCLPTAGVSSL